MNNNEADVFKTCGAVVNFTFSVLRMDRAEELLEARSYCYRAIDILNGLPQTKEVRHHAWCMRTLFNQLQRRLTEE